MNQQIPPKRLYRSRANRLLGGVCGGLAEYFNVDPTIMRIIIILLTLLGGVMIVIYIVLWVIVPENPKQSVPYKKVN